MKRVAVIGGGASGMIAAICASENGAQVTIFEHNSELGRKLLMTGNGKCNLTNMQLLLSAYYSDCKERLNDFFTQFDNNSTIEFFRRIGLVVSEKNGYVYPYSEQSLTVRDVLLRKIESLKIEVITDTDITSISKENDVFTVIDRNEFGVFDSIILACGSYAGIQKKDRIESNRDGYSLAYHLGAKIDNVKPVLTGIICKDEYFKDISGVRATANIIIRGKDGSEYHDTGEIQFADYGISGIPVFGLSHIISEGNPDDYEIEIDLFPSMSDEEYLQFMRTRLLAYQGETVSSFFLGLINSKLSACMMKLSSLKDNDIVDIDDDRIIDAITYMRYLNATPKSVRSFEHAQCAMGGVSLKQIDSNCMLKENPGVYMCGELLNVDGKCGGYNLQWAWTTGYIAGTKAALN